MEAVKERGIDPVCGSEVDVRTPWTAGYRGATYYFCSEATREEFRRHPDWYARRIDRMDVSSDEPQRR